MSIQALAGFGLTISIFLGVLAVGMRVAPKDFDAARVVRDCEHYGRLTGRLEARPANDLARRVRVGNVLESRLEHRVERQAHFLPVRCAARDACVRGR